VGNETAKPAKFAEAPTRHKDIEIEITMRFILVTPLMNVWAMRRGLLINTISLLFPIGAGHRTCSSIQYRFITRSGLKLKTGERAGSMNSFRIKSQL
jgi:hypothetical protein